MEPGENIKFEQYKILKFIRELGSGGTGVANLFKDETTNTLFAIKKYEPSEGNIAYKEELYHRFIEEIVILFKLSHPNIVRVYNYYLYPKFMTGFLQMEYIEGVSIDVYVRDNSADLDKLFRSAVNSFECLEENNILHRDIRPANIMIDNNGELKLIDFGFGKILSNTNTDNSIQINWQATEMPEEVTNGNDYYTVVTEIYFLGSLFRRLVRENNIEDFGSMNVLNKMCEVRFENRYQSFKDVSADIAEGVLSGTDFSEREKIIYQYLADLIIQTIYYYTSDFSPISDVDIVQVNLEKLIRNSSLEEKIQDNSALISCFLTNGYSYSTDIVILVEEVKDFYRLLIDSDQHKKKIILENLITRLNVIETRKPIIDIDDEDLPF